MHKRLAAALAAAVAGTTLAPSANADALYFEKVNARADAEFTCYRVAKTLARKEGFQNVHIGPNEVAGEKGGAYIAITCVGRGVGPPTVAVVMSVAPNFATAQTVGHAVAQLMTTTIPDPLP